MDKRVASPLLFIAVLILTASFPASGQAALRTLDRDESPVVLAGSALPAFGQVPLGQIFVYAYSGGSWEQIPWQFDEVADGHFTATGNGMLDGVDQLAFMGRDTGDQAPSEAWINNPASRQYPRYEITVTDPLAPAKKGWVYVYRSTTDTVAATEDYADANPGEWLLTTTNFLMHTVADKVLVDRLEMHGSGVDVADRNKIRAQITIPQPPSVNIITEDMLQTPTTVTFLDGRVRVIAASDVDNYRVNLIAYRSAYQFEFFLDFSGLDLALDWLRLSADLSPAAAGGTYYDANTPGGVAVDGTPDQVAETPATDWWQVSGSTGTVVQSLLLADAGGTRSNYYKDDAATDPSDTGDQQSYADCGLFIAAPNQAMTLRFWYDILPADQPRVGTTYLNYATHPLQAQARKQGTVSAGAWLNLLL